MATSYQLLSLNTAGPYRRARLAGRDYLVVPLTSIVPGVLHGSQGPLYYPPAEVATNVRAWDDMPLTLYHPEDPRTGAPAHAGAAGVLERQGIGFIRDSVYNGRLQHEAWFDLGRLRRAESARALGNPGYPAVLPRLLRGEPVEVSTGLYTDNLPAPRGYLDHRGRPYSGLVARNYHPDHMAVLPDQRGACSLADGCGVGVRNATGQPRDKAGRFAAAAEKASAEAHKRGTVGHHEKAHAAHTKAAEAYAAQETHEGNLKSIYHLERAQDHAPKPAMTMADLIAKDRERAEMVNRTRGFTQNKAGGDGAGYTINPFVSEAQRRACHAADDPAWDCDEWEAATPDRKLPERKPGAQNAARPAAGKGPAGPLEQGDAEPRAADGKFAAHGEDAAAADPDGVVAEAGAAAMTARVPRPGKRATHNAAAEQAPAVAGLVTTLLHAATAAHILHLTTRSFAAHTALDELYKGLPGLADALAEAWQGKAGRLLGPWPDGFRPPAQDPETFVAALADWFAVARPALGADSELQNLADEVAGFLDGVAYKLRFLA